MGGIAGVVQRHGEPVDAAVLGRMSAALAHRGPRGEVVWLDGPVGFIHRRDGVLPPIWPVPQPASDASGRFQIVCSGRIFNARSMAEGLDAVGVATDGSVLGVMLGAYVQWGEAAFERMNGAFACAIWDRRDRRLVLARDHFGVKPLFYALADDAIVFASEVKAVLSHPAISRAPDERGIASYLACNRYLLQSETTFYRGVHRLMPAQVLSADAVSVSRRTYWSLDPSRHAPVVDDEACIEEVRALLVDAVRLRLPDGARWGAALSGGMDSSSVVCLMDHLNRTERGGHAGLDTFSFNFGTDEADELPLIDLVAKHVGARHHHLQVLSPDFFDDLDDLIRMNDGPTLENSVLLLWKKKRSVREAGVDVILSGLGGDELFMGRLNYFADLFRRGRWGALVREIRSVYPVDPSTGKRTSLRRLLAAYLLSPFVPDWVRSLAGSHGGRPFPPPWMSAGLIARTGIGRRFPVRGGPRFSSVYDQDCADVFHYELIGGAVPYHDVAGAAFAVDTRFPLLDVRLVETMFAMPRRWKIEAGEVRRLQKRALSPWLPPEILRDHLKKDFHPTLNRFQRTAYRDRFAALFASRRRLSEDYVNWAVLKTLYDDFQAGRLHNPFPLWLGLNLERWLARGA